MERFSADWLALREPADTAARSEPLTRLVAARLTGHGEPRALDLACGTGANVRYLAPHLPTATSWTLVDHDQELLTEARTRLGRETLGEAFTLTARCLDLTHLDPSVVAGQHLVTASALLDLVSTAWMQALAHACRQAGATVLLTLSFDGRTRCDPPELEDERVRTLLLRHQHRDKGFGPALGPEAVTVADACLAAEGFTVRTTHSDWMLEPDEMELQRELVRGWAQAALELDPFHRAAILDWEERRLAHIHAGESRIRVGHRDLAAWV